MIPILNIGIIWRMFALRYWVKQPFTTIILVLIVALGVATFLSIRMANRAAISNFQLFSEVISDGSDWVIDSDSGFLNSEDLRLTRKLLGADPVFILPILETTIAPLVSEMEIDHRSYRLVSSDSFALRNLLYETGKNQHNRISIGACEGYRRDLSNYYVRHCGSIFIGTRRCV